MDKKILGFNQDTVYAMIIILILVILGVITFHYYAFISSGDNSALSAGFGAGFKIMPTEKKEHLDGEGILVVAQESINNAKNRYCESVGCNKFTKDKCPLKCTLGGCECK